MELDKFKILELHSQGLGCKRIAKSLGLHHASVFRVVRKNTGVKHTPYPTKGNELEIKFFKTENNLNTAAEDFAAFFFGIHDWSVYKPIVNQSADFLVEKDGKYLKIQVKSSCCEHDSGNHIFSLRKTRNNAAGTKKTLYQKGEVDYFFLFDIKFNAWMIPFELLENAGSVTPELTFPGYKVFCVDSAAEKIRQEKIKEKQERQFYTSTCNRCKTEFKVEVGKKRLYCGITCNNRNRELSIWPPDDEFLKMVTEKGPTAVARELKTNHKTVRQRQQYLLKRLAEAKAAEDRSAPIVPGSEAPDV